MKRLSGFLRKYDYAFYVLCLCLCALLYCFSQQNDVITLGLFSMYFLDMIEFSGELIIGYIPQVVRWSVFGFGMSCMLMGLINKDSKWSGFGVTGGFLFFVCAGAYPSNTLAVLLGASEPQLPELASLAYDLQVIYLTRFSAPLLVAPCFSMLAYLQIRRIYPKLGVGWLSTISRLCATAGIVASIFGYGPVVSIVGLGIAAIDWSRGPKATDIQALEMEVSRATVRWVFVGEALIYLVYVFFCQILNYNDPRVSYYVSLTEFFWFNLLVVIAPMLLRFVVPGYRKMRRVPKYRAFFSALALMYLSACASLLLIYTGATYIIGEFTILNPMGWLMYSSFFPAFTCLTLAIFGLFEFLRKRPILLGVALLAAPVFILLPVGQRPGFPDFVIGLVPCLLIIACSCRGVGKESKMDG